MIKSRENRSSSTQAIKQVNKRINCYSLHNPITISTLKRTQKKVTVNINSGGCRSL